MAAVAVVLAAGSGERLGAGKPKAFIEIGGQTLLALACRAAAASTSIASLLVVVREGTETAARGSIAVSKPFDVVAGGATRQGSTRAALAMLPEDADLVLIHDAARPFATPELFERVLAGLRQADGVVPVVPVADTVKRVQGGFVVATESREGLSFAQTPQAFRADVLSEAYDRAERAGLDFTDDAAVVEWAGFHVASVPGELANMKVTTPLDLALAETLLAQLGADRDG